MFQRRTILVENFCRDGAGGARAARPLYDLTSTAEIWTVNVIVANVRLRLPTCYLGNPGNGIMIL